MNRIHVAVVDEELPYPLNSGKRIRTYNLLRRLAERKRITFLAHRHADPQEESRAVEAMREIGIEPVFAADRVAPKSGWGFPLRLAGNLFSPLPYSVTTHATPAMATAVRYLQQMDRPDLWHCEWTPYAHLMHGRSVNWVVMAHNVESIIWRRWAESESRPLHRWYLSRQAAKYERFEAWAYSAAHRAIAVSPEDADRMIRDFGTADPAVVENGVDTDYFVAPVDTAGSAAAGRRPERILFLGSLDWRPNQDAVQLLLDQIFPAVRRDEPSATLVIVGRHPPEWLIRRVHQSDGVELHADVPDVRPYLHSAGMLAVPLRIGGGSRLKILEALACGTPVVSTRIGAEGLRIKNDEHALIVDSPDDMSAAMTRTIRTPGLSRIVADRGRRWVRAEYDWAGLAERLDRIWSETISKSRRPTESTESIAPIDRG